MRWHPGLSAIRHAIIAGSLSGGAASASTAREPGGDGSATSGCDFDQGVFHNDMIAVGNREVLFYHARPFWTLLGWMDELKHKLAALWHGIHPLEVSADEVDVKDDAVENYSVQQPAAVPGGRRDGFAGALRMRKTPAGSGLSEIVAPAWEPLFRRC